MKKLYGVWFKNSYEPLAMLDIKLTDKTLKPYEPVNTYLLYKALFMGARPTDIRAAFVALKKGAFPNVIKKDPVLYRQSSRDLRGILRT